MVYNTGRVRKQWGDKLRVTEKLKRRSQLPFTQPVNFTGLLMILMVLIAGLLFVQSSYFAVGNVVIRGNKYITDADICRIAGIPDKINIFRLNTGEIRERLLRDLRVAEVDISRQFPATIIISITERQPIAYAANSYGFVQLDRHGVVIAAAKTIKQIDVPIITGINLGDVYIGDRVEAGELRPVLTYLAALDEVTLNRLSEVNIDVPDQMLAYTTDSICIKLGEADRLEEKAKLTQSILQEINLKKLAVEYIDLSFKAPFIKFK